jgi:hypothetical protein
MTLFLLPAFSRPEDIRKSTQEILRSAEFASVAMASTVEQLVKLLQGFLSRYFHGHAAEKGLNDLFENLRWLLQLTSVRYTLMAIVVVLFILLLLYFRGLLGRSFISLKSLKEKTLRGSDRLDPARLEGEAERLACAGDYLPAMRSLYLALLLHLARRRMMRFDPSRTNNEIQEALSDRSEVASLLTPFNRVFESICYALKPCRPEEYDAFLRSYLSLKETVLGDG